jgi:hypothetical protein
MQKKKEKEYVKIKEKLLEVEEENRQRVCKNKRKTIGR